MQLSVPEEEVGKSGSGAIASSCDCEGDVGGVTSGTCRRCAAGERGWGTAAEAVKEADSGEEAGDTLRRMACTAGKSLAVSGDELPTGEEGGVKLGTEGRGRLRLVLLFTAGLASAGRSVLIHSILPPALGWEPVGCEEALEEGGWESWRFRSGADGRRAASDGLPLWLGRKAGRESVMLGLTGKNWRLLAGGEGEAEPEEAEDRPAQGESLDEQSEAVDEKPDTLSRRHCCEEAEEADMGSNEEDGVKEWGREGQSMEAEVAAWEERGSLLACGGAAK